MNNLFLFLDTETTGLLDFNTELSKETLDQFPHIVELAWVLTNDSGRILDSDSKLIQPSNWGSNPTRWEITNSDIHGIDQKTAEKFGYPMGKIFTHFENTMLCFEKEFTLVAHNLKFDMTVLQANYMRIGRDHWFPESRICTMLSSVEYCSLPSYQKGEEFKKPSLSELYQKLFEREFVDQKSALTDCMAVKDCFFALVELRVITL